MGNRGTWRGRITEGRLRGYQVEVRVSGEPIPIYVIAYHAPRVQDAAPVGFAVGEEALRAHFVDLGARIDWSVKLAPRRPRARRPMAGVASRREISVGGSLSRSPQGDHETRWRRRGDPHERE